MQTSVAPRFPCLDGLFRDLTRIEEVSVGLAGATAEGAELASDKTDVGEIDVAIDDVSDDVAGKFAAQEIGSDEKAEEVIAFGIGEK